MLGLQHVYDNLYQSGIAFQFTNGLENTFANWVEKLLRVFVFEYKSYDAKPWYCHRPDFKNRVGKINSGFWVSVNKLHQKLMCKPQTRFLNRGEKQIVSFKRVVWSG